MKNGGISMDINEMSTHEFVEFIHDKQRKDEKNRKRGNREPEKKLPAKAHYHPKRSK